MYQGLSKGWSHHLNIQNLVAEQVRCWQGPPNAMKTDNLSSIPGLHMFEGVDPWFPHVSCGTHMPLLYRRTQNRLNMILKYW